MSVESDFFLKSKRNVVQIELLEISHPNFSQTYYICRNYKDGVTVKLETDAFQYFEYMPCKITNDGAKDDLDAGIQVTFADLGELIPKEIQRIEDHDNFKTYPLCKYRVYLSTNTNEPFLGPYTFEIPTVSNNQKGATFNAKAPGLNVSRTGELYRIDRFPMLRGFL